MHSHRSDVARIDRGIWVAHQHHVEDAGAERCYLSEVHDEVCTSRDRAHFAMRSLWSDRHILLLSLVQPL